MAQRRTIWALDIGTTAIKAVALDTAAGKGILRKVEIIALPPERDDALIVNTIKKILAEFKTREFAISLAGRPALIRCVYIPAVAAVKIEATLKIEVQHRIPFPLEQVVWSFRQLPGISGTIDFIIGAIKKDIVRKTMSLFAKFKEEILFLDADPIVLLNLVSGAPDFDRTKTYAILDLGAESSNLIVFQGNLVLVRALTITGNTFTENLKEERSTESAEAEKEKISLTAESELPTSITQTIDNLLSEIQASVDYWRFTQKGPELNYFLITGGSASLPGLAKTLEGRLRIPTRTLDPFANINLEEGAEIKPETQNRLAVAVGLALRAQNILPCPYALDFLPPEYIRLKKTRRNRLFVYFSLVLAMFLSFSPSFFFYQESKVKGIVIQQLNSNLNEYEQYLPAIQDMEREISELQERYKNLGGILNRRYLWLSRLITLGRILPSSEIYLTKFTPQENTLILDGVAKSSNLGLAFRDVRQFILNLNSLPSFQNAAVVSLERDSTGQLTFQIRVGVK